MPVELIFDILILGGIGWGAYQGYKGGLLSEVVGLLHFLIAFGLSILVLKFVFNFVANFFFEFHNVLFPELVVASSVGLALFLLSTAGQYLKTEIEYDFPGAWDNITGALFGVIKYIFVLSFFFWFTTALGKFDNRIKVNSISYRIVEPLSYSVFGYKNDEELSMAVRTFVGNIRVRQ